MSSKPTAVELAREIIDFASKAKGSPAFTAEQVLCLAQALLDAEEKLRLSRSAHEGSVRNLQQHIAKLEAEIERLKDEDGDRPLAQWKRQYLAEWGKRKQSEKEIERLTKSEPAHNAPADDRLYSKHLKEVQWLKEKLRSCYGYVLAHKDEGLTKSLLADLEEILNIQKEREEVKS